jgi:hypothetical protein
MQAPEEKSFEPAAIPLSKFLNSRITVFPAAICATPKTQREKAASSLRDSRPVSKDEADPWQIRHPHCFICCN